MNSGVIADNKANVVGGGITVNPGQFTMNSGNITKNAAKYAGGVCIHDSYFTMTGGTIMGNKADYLSSKDVLTNHRDRVKVSDTAFIDNFDFITA